MTRSGNKQIRVLLVDEQKMVRSGLRMVLERKSPLKVVGEASTLGEAVNIARRKRPEVTLYVNEKVNKSDTDSMARLQNVAPNTRVLVMTDEDYLDRNQPEVRRRSAGVVQKTETSAGLVRAIKKVNSAQAQLKTRRK
jgi:DNA-binding NarL/FixJ family response regulator